MTFPKLFPVRVGYVRPFPGYGKTDGNLKRKECLALEVQLSFSGVDFAHQVGGERKPGKERFQIGGREGNAYGLGRLMRVSIVGLEAFFSFHVFFSRVVNNYFTLGKKTREIIEFDAHFFVQVTQAPSICWLRRVDSAKLRDALKWWEH